MPFRFSNPFMLFREPSLQEQPPRKLGRELLCPSPSAGISDPPTILPSSHSEEFTMGLKKITEPALLLQMTQDPVLRTCNCDPRDSNSLWPSWALYSTHRDRHIFTSLKIKVKSFFKGVQNSFHLVGVGYILTT